MIDGQRNTSIPIYILHDDEPELTESLHVTLLSDSIQGGAHLDEITSCYVNILENDHPYGLIGKLFLLIFIFYIKTACHESIYD